MIIPKLIISIILFGGFFLFATNIELFMPYPEDIEICGWWGVCIPDIPATLAARADWSFNAILIQGVGSIITLIIVIFVWTRAGIPGKGGRFGSVSK